MYHEAHSELHMLYTTSLPRYSPQESKAMLITTFFHSKLTFGLPLNARQGPANGRFQNNNLFEELKGKGTATRQARRDRFQPTRAILLKYFAHGRHGEQ